MKLLTQSFKISIGIFIILFLIRTVLVLVQDQPEQSLQQLEQSNNQNRLEQEKKADQEEYNKTMEELKYQQYKQEHGE